ncbi:hypothetical protein [Arthrobacter sp. SO3]|uniref:hypothetical protein n=1 Tax=Arthrobacter sp. SO3 TaxID=1897057 RepID=UPI001CFFFBED|nr:hypothetical protein [Arthrobacter sp. SO3]MCB5291003.1 hypothetical protein [Arthrobacter sp. SO3]
MARLLMYVTKPSEMAELPAPLVPPRGELFQERPPLSQRQCPRIMFGHGQNLEGDATGRSLPKEPGEGPGAGAKALLHCGEVQSARAQITASLSTTHPGNPSARDGPGPCHLHVRGEALR